MFYEQIIYTKGVIFKKIFFIQNLPNMDLFSAETGWSKSFLKTA